jgi:hypothetical protein
LKIRSHGSLDSSELVRIFVSFVPKKIPSSVSSSASQAFGFIVLLCFPCEFSLSSLERSLFLIPLFLYVPFIPNRAAALRYAERNAQAAVVRNGSTQAYGEHCRLDLSETALKRRGDQRFEGMEVVRERLAQRRRVSRVAEEDDSGVDRNDDACRFGGGLAGTK